MIPVILDGKLISQQLIVEVGTEVQSINNEYGIIPGLAVVLVGDNPASMVYVRNKSKIAKKLNASVKELDGIYNVWWKIYEKHRKKDRS